MTGFTAAISQLQSRSGIHDAQADVIHLATELAPEPEGGKGKRARKPTAKQGAYRSGPIKTPVCWHMLDMLHGWLH